MSKSKSKAFAMKLRGSAMQDRANGLVDGDRFVAPTYDLSEIASMFTATRLAALALGELHGEPVLPGDAEAILDCILIGIVERDAPVEELISLDTPFSVRRADFASGDWSFVMVDRKGSPRKVAFK